MRRQDTPKRGRAVVSELYDGEPVLFLDIDETIAPGHGQAIDPAAAMLVQSLVRSVGAVIVLCSDRVRSNWVEATMTELHLWIRPHHFRGQCDPDPVNSRPLPSTATSSGQITNSKIRRVVEWLDHAQNLGKNPAAWCVLDDSRTFSRDWRTCTQHVQPSGPIVTTKDLTRCWGLLTREVPRGRDVFAATPGPS